VSLRRAAIRVVETYGLVHQVNLRALRSYIKTHTEEELLGEIRDIKESPLLRALWEAGLSQRLQDEVLKQLGRGV